jgi:quinol monooxygenase YgiN
MSHVVALQLQVQPAKMAEFMAMFVPALDDTRAREGCELIECYVDEANPNVVLVWEKWDKPESQQSYMAWRAETGFVDSLGQYMAGAPTFTTYLAQG